MKVHDSHRIDDSQRVKVPFLLEIRYFGGFGILIRKMEWGSRPLQWLFWAPEEPLMGG